MGAGFAGTVVVSLLTSFTALSTPYWLLAMIFGGLGISLGLIAAPATDAVMGSIPKEKAGVGSAMNTVSRTIAGAVGVAALGSVLNSVYRGSFEKGSASIHGLASELAEAAGESVGAGVIVGSQIPGEIGAAVVELAKTSFMDGWRVMAYIACGLSAVGLWVVLKFMPRSGRGHLRRAGGGAAGSGNEERRRA